MKKKRRKVKMGTSLVFAVVAILFVTMSINCVSLMKKNAKMNEKIAIATEQLNAEKERSEELKEKEAYTKTDSYIEDVAHEKLGLVHENELYITPEAN